MRKYGDSVEIKEEPCDCNNIREAENRLIIACLPDPLCLNKNKVIATDEDRRERSRRFLAAKHALGSVYCSLCQTVHRYGAHKVKGMGSRVVRCETCDMSLKAGRLAYHLGGKLHLDNVALQARMQYAASKAVGTQSLH